MDVRSRIVGHGEEPPEQLLANPLNFRRHPGHQMDALRGSMKELGWVKTVLVNRRSGYVLDGHARVEEAIRQRLKTVPITYVDLSPEEERLALAVLDPITEIAIRDQEALSALLSEVTTQDKDLQAFLASIGGQGVAVDEAELPALSSDDRPEIGQMTFTLHRDQQAQIEMAMAAASELGPYIDTGNENANGNALARVCETFLTKHGHR